MPRDRQGEQERRKLGRLIRRKAGTCVDCARNRPVPNAGYCRECYLKRTAFRHLGAARYWPELDALLLQQGGKCAYTGKLIKLGENSSLEHVEPVSRFPARANDIKNMRWVVKEVNLAKRNMTLKEFLGMCRKVLRNFGWIVTKR